MTRSRKWSHHRSGRCCTSRQYSAPRYHRPLSASVSCYPTPPPPSRSRRQVLEVIREEVANDARYVKRRKQLIPRARLVHKKSFCGEGKRLTVNSGYQKPGVLNQPHSRISSEQHRLEYATREIDPTLIEVPPEFRDSDPQINNLEVIQANTLSKRSLSFSQNHEVVASKNLKDLRDRHIINKTIVIRNKPIISRALSLRKEPTLETLTNCDNDLRSELKTNIESNKVTYRRNNHIYGNLQKTIAAESVINEEITLPPPEEFEEISLENDNQCSAYDNIQSSTNQTVSDFQVKETDSSLSASQVRISGVKLKENKSTASNRGDLIKNATSTNHYSDKIIKPAVIESFCKAHESVLAKSTKKSSVIHEEFVGYETIGNVLPRREVKVEGKNLVSEIDTSERNTNNVLSNLSDKVQEERYQNKNTKVKVTHTDLSGNNQEYSSTMSRPQILHIVDSKRNRTPVKYEKPVAKITANSEDISKPVATSNCNDNVCTDENILRAQEENKVTSKLRSLFEERSHHEKADTIHDPVRCSQKPSHFQTRNSDALKTDTKQDANIIKPRIIATLSVEDENEEIDSSHNPTADKSNKIIGVMKETEKINKSESNAANKKPAFIAFSCNEQDDSQKYVKQSDDSKSGITKNTQAENHENTLRSNKYDSKTKAAAFDGLLQYLQDYRHGLRELLVNNNVVIIEPIRESEHRQHSSVIEILKKNNSSRKNGNAISCRITGATVKKSRTNGSEDQSSPASANTLPRPQKSQQPVLRRHFFYYPRRSNRELVDEELPDPDTVKNARKVFEQSQKLITSEHMNDNIDNKSERKAHSVDGEKHDKNNKRRLVRYLTIDTVLKHNALHHRWTDSGSLSSGVSSDLSCYETDLESPSPSGETFSRNSSHKEEQIDIFSSDDNDDADGEEKKYSTSHVEEQHYVAPEVLEKIRACGTSVTYYGGRVISYTKGSQRSPMTSAIMDEIRQRNDSSRGMKIFRDKYLGVKFRLVKSNSCGSRLELAGTEDEGKFPAENTLHVRNQRSPDIKNCNTLNVIGEERSNQCEATKSPKTEKSFTVVTNNVVERKCVPQNSGNVTSKICNTSSENENSSSNERVENCTDLKESDCSTSPTDTKCIFEESFRRQEISRKSILAAYNMTPSSKPCFDEMEFEEFEVVEDPRFANKEKDKRVVVKKDKNNDNEPPKKLSDQDGRQNENNQVNGERHINNSIHEIKANVTNNIEDDMGIKLTTWANHSSKSIMFDFRDSKEGHSRFGTQKTDNHSSC